ncbi:sedoheptulose 7-phosphate cyclase [Mycobacterium haemophilum]|uniref:2-epi-5-epi-valiolone synthase n=1 Tax=Mycobacterium haemophilum TaxID=29311 RepID=A0A0I9VH80_9MYCO|nr:sedoheptulose 7-phosphate cyclase [Mycobacterium haemophilum]AKN16280.1 2-epi-5-epi-valiolone synthase [Mycobacterium haemophilum DSM 44634]KLO32397.1 2-epi-5-epi-valiolone synthase [Mycobacterium haemophilum]KLO38611.1 2-epi-5-epi-valiolone synthase [Mycobacterium haemophilum]KLO44945.1 2-epi-5-epi-valiolone synthase [Mycobacterium haemophilum]KLO56289.1 2-epi-5-epi-valiolone synthase [Mycobacterium haemophilum]
MTDILSTRRVKYASVIEYEVVNAPNLFVPESTALLSSGKVKNGCRFVVVDENVDRHYGDEMRSYFTRHGIKAKIVVFPGGEENKTAEYYFSIVRELDAFPIHRRDEPIIAIGGGVLTDVVAFVASTYRRGVPHIKVPTTLMGYVDGSVGIKNGINFNGNKNRLGAFQPPQKVLLDKSFLRTLPRRHILNGVCEIIKLAVIADAGLFHLLEAHGPESVDVHLQNDEGCEILDRAVAGMLAELEPNLYEVDLDRKMDFGHTFSYGLETHHASDLLHGEAVLLDVLLSVLIARSRNLLADEETSRIFDLVEKLTVGLDMSLLEPHLLWGSLQERVYHRNGLQRVPMPQGIGSCIFLNDISYDEISNATKALEDWMVLG